MEKNKLKKLTWVDLRDAFQLFFSWLIYQLCKKKYSGCWLMCERYDSAEDNGWILYQWIRRHHPEKKVYFVLGKKTKQIKERENDVHQDQNLVVWKSLKHYILYLSSPILVRTMFLTPRPCRRICYYYEKLVSKKPQIVYLRHGISKDSLELHRYEVQQARLFICGAKPEYDYISRNAGYPEGYVQYTGFARFDDLLDGMSDERFVLIMPTWRRYIGKYNKTHEENEQLFLDSAYYKHFRSLLTNKDFIDEIVNAGYNVKFCIHAMFRRYAHLFKDVDSRIEIVNDNVTVHELLMSCSLLITDYSSVFFDVAYMKKPMVFYQFDYEEFRQKHFSEGYFSYKRDGMGPVVETQEELIEAMMAFYDGEKFTNTDFYLQRCDAFFPTHDNHNCERIYQAIMDIEQ